MKKTLLLLAVVTLSLTACGKSEDTRVSKALTTSANTTQQADTESLDDVNQDYTVHIKGVTEKEGETLGVQWCTGSLCFRPVSVSRDFTATASLPKDDTYYVHLAGLPETKAYNANNNIQDNSHRDITVNVLPATVLTDDLAITEPSVYKIEFTKDILSRDIRIALADNDYHLESWNDYTLASLDPAFDPSIEVDGVKDDNSGLGNNFALDARLKDGDTVTLKANGAGIVVVDIEGISA